MSDAIKLPSSFQFPIYDFKTTKNTIKFPISKILG